MPDSFDADLAGTSRSISMVSNRAPGVAGAAFIPASMGVVEGEASFFNEGEIEVRELIGDGVDGSSGSCCSTIWSGSTSKPGTTASSPVNSKSGSKPTVRC